MHAHIHVSRRQDERLPFPTCAQNDAGSITAVTRAVISSWDGGASCTGSASLTPAVARAAAADGNAATTGRLLPRTPYISCEKRQFSVQFRTYTCNNITAASRLHYTYGTVGNYCGVSFPEIAYQFSVFPLQACAFYPSSCATTHKTKPPRAEDMRARRRRPRMRARRRDTCTCKLGMRKNIDHSTNPIACITHTHTAL